MPCTASHPRFARGISTIWMVIALPVVMMMAWLALEIGLVVKSGNQAKLAADAIALAAAARFGDGWEGASQDAFAAAGVITDLRGDVLRIGVGLYHDEDDITHHSDIAAGF